MRDEFKKTIITKNLLCKWRNNVNKLSVGKNVSTLVSYILSNYNTNIRHFL